MHFQHSPAIWQEFPELVAGVLHGDGITADASVDSRVAEHYAAAQSRLTTGSVAELPEIQAWRRAYTRMGLKPTQYRAASESLLRRFRKEGSVPRFHPLIDVCNALSLQFAIPVAVFDVARVDGYIEVRHADGDETYLTFSGATETPEPGEVIFADAARRAHARRWVNRQSGLSAVRNSTASVLVVAEAMHDSALTDVEKLVSAIDEVLSTIWSARSEQALLSEASPRFDFEPPATDEVR